MPVFVGAFLGALLVIFVIAPCEKRYEDKQAQYKKVCDKKCFPYFYDYMDEQKNKCVCNTSRKYQP